jgi:hypothetical protein
MSAASERAAGAGRASLDTGDGDVSSHIIIGIHGLANKPTEQVLESWWRAAILEGLQRNQGRQPGRDIAFDLVYWRDWNYLAPVPTAENDEPYLEAPGSGPLPTYADGFWDLLRAEAGDLVGDPLDWLKRSFGIGETAQVVLERKLPDLALYYANPPQRDRLRARLQDRILQYADRRIMLIAHSMGSIVAYDALRLLGRSHPAVAVDHLVTIGSPLGLPHVKYKIFEENDLVRTPSVVRRWTNLADRRDPVAADTHLAGDYAAGPPPLAVEVEDDLVLNSYVSPAGKANPHKSYGYLRTPELSRLIRGFI